MEPMPRSPSKLSQKEIDQALTIFVKYDVDSSGSIDQNELKKMLQSLGQNPSQEEILYMMAMLDTDHGGRIEFTEFLKAVRFSFASSDSSRGAQRDTLEAFVALGGNEDKSGYVTRSRIVQVSNKFGLNMDLDVRSSCLGEWDELAPQRLAKTNRLYFTLHIEIL
jgi:Ca2+-binding EF-hand superfamily protein